MTIRIPAQSLDVFVDQVGEVSNIVSTNKSVDDITLNYVSTESRMKAFRQMAAASTVTLGRDS